MHSIALVLCAGLSLFAPAQQKDSRTLRLETDVQRELLALPYYTVFDFLAFRIEPGGTVRLLGQVVRGQRPAVARPGQIDRLAPRDRQDPGAQVRVVAQARVGTQRGHEGLLECVVGVARPDQCGQEAEHLVAMTVEERLEGRKGHDWITVPGAGM